MQHARSGPAKSGRISAAHSAFQDKYLRYFESAAISSTRTEIMFSGHGVFRGLVKPETVANLRCEAIGIPATQFRAIFNNIEEDIVPGCQRKRSMSKAPAVGHAVNKAIFEFLSRRALIATKWHDLELARYSVYLRSESGAMRQTPHTDFDPSKMSKTVEDQPEYGLAKSFSVMTVLQPTKLYFVDAEGVQVPEILEAGDVVVWFGDVDHCGAEWTEAEAANSFATFGDSHNYRLFSYVPSCYKPEFLIPWIVCQRNRKLLTLVDDGFATSQDLFEQTDPDKDAFRINIFRQYLRYGANIYLFNDVAYSLGIDSFSMRPAHQRRLPRKVESNVSGKPCPHFPNVRAEFYETKAYSASAVTCQFRQLKRNCPYCYRPTQKRPRASSSSSLSLDLTSIEDCIPGWALLGETDLEDAAQSFLAVYKRVANKYQ